MLQWNRKWHHLPRVREQVGARAVSEWGRRLDGVITEKRIMCAGQIKVPLKLVTIEEKECKPAKAQDSPPPAVLSSRRCRLRKSRAVELISESRVCSGRWDRRTRGSGWLMGWTRRQS